MWHFSGSPGYKLSIAVYLVINKSLQLEKSRLKKGIFIDEPSRWKQAEFSIQALCFRHSLATQHSVKQSNSFA